MDALISLHGSQPYWIWLAIGLLLLAIESALSTEWLLWPAVAAGIVAVLTAVGLQYGFAVEVIAFGLLTAGLTLLSNKLIKRMNPADMPDINDRDSRLIGQQAQVITPFLNGRGRVFISGSEWAAELEGDALPEVGSRVVVETVEGARLKVRTP
jgi:inner membrane protein